MSGCRAVDSRTWRGGWRTYAAVLVLLVLAETSASAQTMDTGGEIYVPELRSAPRLMIGAGGGLGVVDGTCDECRMLGAVAVELYGGLQLHRRVAVLLDSWTTVHFLPADGDNPGVTGYPVATLAIQTWITPIIFVRSGIGLGGLAVLSRQVDGLDHGPAFSLVFGGELGHRKASGIDLSVRLSAGSSQYSDLTAPWYISFGFVIGYHRNIEIGARQVDP